MDFALTPAQALDRLSSLLALARARGATAADAVATGGHSLTATIRLGQLEELAASEAVEIGLRLFVGQRSASVMGSDLSAAGLQRLVDQALGMARHAPADDHAGLVDRALLWGGSGPALDLVDPLLQEVEPAGLEERARAAEDAARAVAAITRSDGASASAGWGWRAHATTEGFAALGEASHASLSVAVVAGEGDAAERDHDWTMARHLADLRPAADVGRTAGERAVARLGASRLASGRIPVVFAPRVATSFLGHLVAALSGPAVAQGRSFLCGRLGKPLFGPEVRIVEDPHRPRGLRSRLYDSEGVPSCPRLLVDSGCPCQWLAERASASRLGVVPSGHAVRALAETAGVGVANLWLEPGRTSVSELMADIKIGLYVTELSGSAVNLLTGDYSRGASGLAIRNGALAEPVAGVTLAGHLRDMFARLTAADDLVHERGIDSPTVRVDSLYLAGA